MKEITEILHPVTGKPRVWVTEPALRAARPLAMNALSKVEPQPAAAAVPFNFIIPSVRPRWIAAGVSQYTPQRVEQVFRMALAGDLESQWEMFDLMESTWPRLSKNLNELKDFVVSLAAGEQSGSMRYQVKPFGKEPTPEAKKRAELIEEVLWAMEPNPAGDENDLEDTIRDLMDARGKGISILEVDWMPMETSHGTVIGPRCTRWVHPQFYGYPDANRLMLKNNGDRFAKGRENFTDFPENKFIIGVAKNKTGHPLGAAMLHCLGFWWAASNFTSEWFLNFAQVFGQPIRWATYDPNMSAPDQAKLADMLENMGSASWGMFPAVTQMELKEAMKNAGDSPQMALLNIADKVCDILILRQTLTSDVGAAGQGSRALGEVHERKEDGVKLGCGRWVGKTLKQLLRSICILNFGDDTECPSLVILMEDEEEDKELGELLVNVANAGLEPTDKALPEISKRLNFEVQRKVVAPITPPLGAETNLAAKNASVVPTGNVSHPSDVIAARKAKALGEIYRGSMAPFRNAVLASNSKAECLETLAKLYSDWKPERLASELEIALQVCAAAGASAASRNELQSLSASDAGGSWITVNGEHVFIKDGQSAGDAIKQRFADEGNGKMSRKSVQKSLELRKPEFDKVAGRALLHDKTEFTKEEHARLVDRHVEMQEHARKMVERAESQVTETPKTRSASEIRDSNFYHKIAGQEYSVKGEELAHPDGTPTQKFWEVYHDDAHEGLGGRSNKDLFRQQGLRPIKTESGWKLEHIPNR